MSWISNKVGVFDVVEITISDKSFKGTILSFTHLISNSYFSDIPYQGINVLTNKGVMEFKRYNPSFTDFNINQTRMVFFEKNLSTFDKHNLEKKIYRIDF